MIKWICMFAFYFYSVVYSKFNLRKVTCCSCVWRSTPSSAFSLSSLFPVRWPTGPLLSYLWLIPFSFHKHLTLLTCFWESILSTFLPRYGYEGFSWEDLLVCLEARLPRWRRPTGHSKQLKCAGSYLYEWIIYLLPFESEQQSLIVCMLFL